MVGSSIERYASPSGKRIALVDKETGDVWVMERQTRVTLSNPTAAVQKKTEGTDPEDWNTAAGVTVSGVTVVDAFDDEGNAISGASSQAVQFQIDADPDPQPDETDDPVPGKNYRVVITADRSDAGDVIGKPGLTIHP